MLSLVQVSHLCLKLVIEVPFRLENSLLRFLHDLVSCFLNLLGKLKLALLETLQGGPKGLNGVIVRLDHQGKLLQHLFLLSLHLEELLINVGDEDFFFTVFVDLLSFELVLYVANFEL